MPSPYNEILYGSGNEADNDCSQLYKGILEHMEARNITPEGEQLIAEDFRQHNPATFRGLKTSKTSYIV